MNNRCSQGHGMSKPTGIHGHSGNVVTGHTGCLLGMSWDPPCPSSLCFPRDDLPLAWEHEASSWPSYHRAPHPIGQGARVSRILPFPITHTFKS